MESNNSHVPRDVCRVRFKFNGSVHVCAVLLTCLLFPVLPTIAQNLLSLDSCRAMALRNNKQLNIARFKQDVARDV